MKSDEQEIRQLVATWMAASRAGDSETVLSLMTEDVVFLQPGQPLMHKTDFAVAMRAQAGANAAQFDGKSDIQEIRILGDWAFMWAQLRVVATLPDGETITRAGPALSILRKQDGKWLMARDANMLSLIVENNAA